MIDGLLSRVRRAGERVQRRGEEVAQAARLRVDIFQLGRELDVLYARLGRAYHAQASVSTLEDIRAEIARVDEEIAARERLLSELGAASAEPAEAAAAPVTLVKPVASPFAVPGTPAPSSAPQVPKPPLPDAQAALSVWREKEAQRMSDPDKKITGPITDITGRPDGEDADPTRTTGENSGGNPTIPNSDKDQLLGPNTASQGREAERDKMDRHRLLLQEGKMASEDPDPLASKD